jgi:succinate dehydrogenase / fumarate reductase, cytochrome b subunit
MKAGGSKMMNETIEARRPLSPHLSIYRPMLTMMMSIAHRVTGAGLYVGTLLLVWYLVAAASGEAAFAIAASFFGSFFGQLILFGFTFALLHHFFGGVRHFIWDLGYGLEHPMRERLAQATLVCSTLSTIGLFLLARFLR